MGILDEKYVLLTTFRKNGDAVATPVWIAALGNGSGGFTTEAESGKVKRIRNNPRVTLQPCNARGTVHEGSALVEANAEVLSGDDARHVRDAIHRKYAVMTKLFGVAALFRKVIRKPEPVECAIRITLS